VDVPRDQAVSAPIDVAGLALELRRWPSDWTPNLDEEGEWCGSFDAINEESEEPHEIETGPDTSYSVALGKLIADAVNALPALLEVARTALSADEALTAGQGEGVGAWRRSMVRTEPVGRRSASHCHGDRGQEGGRFKLSSAEP